MAWLAKDQDGTERIFSNRPVQWGSGSLGVFTYLGTNWFEPISDGVDIEISYREDSHSNSYIEVECVQRIGTILPNGTIEKILGYDITFDIGPIEI